MEGVSAQSFQNLKIFLALKYLSWRLLIYRALLLLLMLYVIASLVALITDVHVEEQELLVALISIFQEIVLTMMYECHK